MNLEEVPATSRVHLAITVDVPDDKTARQQIIDKVNAENGLGDSGSTYEEFVFLDDPEENDDGWDNAEFAAFLLSNQSVSGTAANYVTNYETDVEAL